MTEEKVIIVDENDQEIQTVPRSKMKRLKLCHRGTAVLVFNSKGEIFVHQRSWKKDRCPGYYDLKAGGVVVAGETPESNVQRELREELGIKNPQVKQLFKFKHDDPNNSSSFQYVFQCLYDGIIHFQDQEVIKGEFLSVEKIKGLIKKENFVPEALTIFQKVIKK